MSSLTNLALPPSKVRRNVVRCLFAGLTPIILSSPGVGKSDLIRSIAHEYRLQEIDFRVPQADVTDFNGLPFRTEDGRAEFLPFTTFPLEGDRLPDGKDGWLLFLDELTSAPKHLQAPAYKLILDRMVGTRRLHERVVIAAAGNLATDKAIVHDMSTALASRLVHLEMRVDHGEWMNWAAQHGVDSRVMAFLTFKPELLHRFNPDSNDKTFACPRTWAFVSKLIQGEDLSLAEDLGLLAGAVSPGPAQEFLGFIEVFNELPKLEAIETSPDTIPVPHEASIKFALATVLAEKMTEKNATALCTFLTRLPVESRVLCVRMLRQRNPALIRHTAVQKVFQPILSRL